MIRMDEADMRKARIAQLRNSDTHSHKIIAAMKEERSGDIIVALSHLQTFRQIKCGAAGTGVSVFL